MNKTIARRNNLGRVSHSRKPRVQARIDALQKWCSKYIETDGGSFKRWSRQDKKQWLKPFPVEGPTPTAYDLWLHRFEKRKRQDAQIEVICGRHVLVPADVCWSDDRKLRMSLVKVNAQGRRRRG